MLKYRNNLLRKLKDISKTQFHLPKVPLLYLSQRRCLCETSHSEEMNLKTVVSRLNKFAPTSLAEGWDNVGLLVEPSPPHVVEKMMLTNDLTEPVLEEAVNKNVNFILSYHPPVFVPMKTLTQRTWKERVVIRCIENRIAVFSPHTSYDALAGGVNDWLVSAFGDGKVEPLHQVLSKAFPTCKGFHVEITGERTSISQFHQQLKSIDGAIVSPCSSFLVNGSSGDDPLETQLTLNCSERALSKVMGQLNDFTDLFQTTEITQLAKPPIPDHGMGRLSKLTKPLKLSEAVSKIKQHLQLEHVRLAVAIGNSKDPVIKKVAVCAGSGGTVLKGVDADLYVTGEMSHHEVLDAVSRGTSVILCDHSNTERGYLYILTQKLTELLEGKVSISVSEIDTDPLKVC